jgi:hypothetical protein
MLQIVPLHALWLPILLSAVIVFVASSILHMLLPIHKSDYRKLPEEDRVLESLRTAGVTTGREYRFPFCSMKDLKDPSTQEKFKKGPVGVLTIMRSGVPNMGKPLAQWFLYCVVISIFAAYLTGRTRPMGTDYLEVFRVAGCSAFMGYSLGLIQNAIWRGETWGVTFKHVIDGLIYGLLTAGTFGWLWPR